MANDSKTVRNVREARGLTQLELARRARISRQALGAIEAGTYQPGVTVAIALARELGQSVESLFGEAGQITSNRIEVEWSAAQPADRSPLPCRVALARVGGKVVAVKQSAAQLTLPAAAGMLERTKHRRAELETHRTQEE